MTPIPPLKRKQAEKLCKGLGFTIDKKKGKGGHFKATHPTRVSTDSMGRTTKFITVPSYKNYSKSLTNEFYRELRNFGFTKKEILEKL